MKKILILMAMFLITNCAVGPDYKDLTSSQLNIPDKWHSTLPHNGSNIQLVDWWKQFNDPTLEFLINAALETNPSIFTAIAKIKQAMANLKGSRSYLFPSITADGSASINQNSITTMGNGANSYSGDVFTNNGMSDGATSGLSLSWELDLFGANRRSIEASEARYAAAKLDWNDAKVSLVAEVADTYVSLRECQNLLVTYQEENTSRLSTQSITELRSKAGFYAKTDVNQANGSLFQNQANIAQQKSICGQYENELVALTGLDYKVLNEKLNVNYGLIPRPESVFISNIPVDVIKQRPDVASAERSLAAANADVGVATANRYPQVSLTGSISANAGSTYVGQPSSWSLGPSISLPLVDGGYLKAQESLSYAKYEEAYANYRNKVVTAVQEIENALIRISMANQRVLSAESATNNYQEYFDAYNKKYNLGWANLLDLETVRVTLLSSKQVLAIARLEQVEAWIALYKAVGGSWGINIDGKNTND